MLSNPKTTIAGYAAIIIIVLYVLYGFWIGKPMDINEVLSLLAGSALAIAAISAKDGRH